MRRWRQTGIWPGGLYYFVFFLYSVWVYEIFHFWLNGFDFFFCRRLVYMFKTSNQFHFTFFFSDFFIKLVFERFYDANIFMNIYEMEILWNIWFLNWFLFCYYLFFIKKNKEESDERWKLSSLAYISEIDIFLHFILQTILNWRVTTLNIHEYKIYIL